MFCACHGITLPTANRNSSWYRPFEKKPAMSPVTISRPFERLKRAPVPSPNRIAIGTASAAASAKPAMPPIFQYVTKITATWPAIAPSTMPKLSPSPASTGIRSESTITAFRAKRESISRSRNSGVRCATHAPNTHRSANRSGTPMPASEGRGRAAGLGAGGGAAAGGVAAGADPLVCVPLIGRPAASARRGSCRSG